jgi:hypothetical protein
VKNNLKDALTDEEAKAKLVISIEWQKYKRKLNINKFEMFSMQLKLFIRKAVENNIIDNKTIIKINKILKKRSDQLFDSYSYEINKLIEVINIIKNI